MVAALVWLHAQGVITVLGIRTLQTIDASAPISPDIFDGLHVLLNIALSRAGVTACLARVCSPSMQLMCSATALRYPMARKRKAKRPAAGAALALTASA
jgi:hypothetical protein